MKVLRMHERLETEQEKYPYFLRTLSKCQLYSTEVNRKGLVSLEGKEREIEFRATFLFQDTRVFTCKSAISRFDLNICKQTSLQT